ncbi:PA0061/PA0062 family lipoprotein [Zestomonas carbonaria]|uniref:Lipoprotein n=1 Tax=Zestomonas carbonaria TaxID=2762745 RepID=A0A7U7I899_9GAMM|nr:hypothetical protein [Pseudomonas carbonaria]CAD5106886.1 hypothetical protein PSEWESI4_01153 [Pseudomonas carbonaria]
MRHLLVAAASLMLGACAAPLPQPDPRQAWVELYTPAVNLLMADRLDRKYWPDGRYFQVSPGAHELEARFQFEAGRGGIGMDRDSTRITCDIRVRYDDFAAGQRYRLEADSMGLTVRAWLYDSQRNPLVEGEVTRCGPF